MSPPVENSYPLSPLQEGMLFDTLSSPAGVDVTQTIVEVGEDLDQKRFAGAWRRVVAAHPALRTSFRWQGLEAPRQDVHRDVEVHRVRHGTWSCPLGVEQEGGDPSEQGGP